MQLTGFFVEYLIIGSTGLVWILPLTALFINISDVNAAIAALFTPSLYVIGVVADSIGTIVTRHQKHKIRRETNEYYGHHLELPADDHMIIQRILSILSLKNVELGNQVAQRVTRARVMRGTLINVLLGILAINVYFLMMPETLPKHLGFWTHVMVCAFGLLMIISLWISWARSQRLIYRFGLLNWAAARDIGMLKGTTLHQREGKV